jgi:hypothetical protein
VGRPGLDPGTLGVFTEGPCMYVTVQICWSYEPDRPSMCVEMLSEWKSWLDNWLDKSELKGSVSITYVG